MNERVLLKSFHRMEDDRFAIYLHELLWHRGMHSLARSASQDECYVVALLHMAQSF
jgi:hypothetical protein